MKTAKQAAITMFCIMHGSITKNQAVELVGDNYHNAGKYVGLILGRMVENGMLIKVSRGTYKMPTESDTAQIKLEL